MAKATQIKALLESALKGDKERLYALAMQIAAAEATKGHGKLAEEIKKMIDEAKSQKPFVIFGWRRRSSCAPQRRTCHTT